jgi:3-oxoacyl-[acyl-carrier protein] reductase
MDLGLAGKRVLVTGATRCIGRETARVFAAESARVAVTYHTGGAEAGALVEEFGGAERAMAVPLDLGDPAVITAAVRAVEDRWGGVDVLVANAQTWVWSDPEKAEPFETMDFGPALDQFRANLEGHLWTVRAVLGGMRRRGWGRIVLLSSVTATHGNPNSELYTTAKGALHGLARGLMWARDGVLANVVAPGATRTESLDNVDPALVERVASETPSGVLSSPADVARVIAFLCSAANSNVNGEVVHVAGGR